MRPTRLLPAVLIVALSACDAPTAAEPRTEIGAKAPTAYLYELRESGSAAGATGTVRTVRVGDQDYPESTSFWVGCDGEPALTTFRFGGTYAGLSGAWALDEETPAGISVELIITADGTQLDRRTLVAGAPATPFELDTAGVEQLELSAERMAGECAPSSYGYGLALDAGVQ